MKRGTVLKEHSEKGYCFKRTQGKGVVFLKNTVKRGTF